MPRKQKRSLSNAADKTTKKKMSSNNNAEEKNDCDVEAILSELLTFIY